MLDIERKVYEWVRIGDIFVRVLEIRADVGLVIFGIDDGAHRPVLKTYAKGLSAGEVLELGSEITIEFLKLESHKDPHKDMKYKVRMGINAPRHVPIERDDMKKNPTRFEPR